MSTAPMPRRVVGNGYPTTDHKPMAETDLHRDLMIDLILTLKAFYAAEPLVYVSGNLLLCYEENNRRRHVSPDVFVVRGVPRVVTGPYYLGVCRPSSAPSRRGHGGVNDARPGSHSRDWGSPLKSMPTTSSAAPPASSTVQRTREA